MAGAIIRTGKALLQWAVRHFNGGWAVNEGGDLRWICGKAQKAPTFRHFGERSKVYYCE